MEWFLCDDPVIVLVHYQMHSRLYINIGHLDIGIIFKHKHSRDEGDSMISSKMEMKLLKLVSNFKSKLLSYNRSLIFIELHKFALLNSSLSIC